MVFEITILGCGAATPTSRHHPSAQVVNLHDKLMLVDCGEGTQMQMRKYGIRLQRISHIFISHMHGDHYLGLMGLISSMHLLGRKTPLYIYGPEGLKEIIELSMRVSQTFMEYSLIFTQTNTNEKALLLEDRTLAVFSFPLKHRIPCCGFQFEEKQRQPKVSKASIASHNLSLMDILELKKGIDVEVDGQIIRSKDITIPAPKPKSYAYCSDTAYTEKTIDYVKGSNLLYHESTFLEEELDRAKSTFHSTAMQAAKIALKSEVKELLLGHFSSRYMNDEAFLHEAKTIFDRSILATEGLTINVI